MQESEDRAFQAYARPLETVTSFKYMGRVLTTAENDEPAVVGNLRKAHKNWSRLTRILGQEGASPRVSGDVFQGGGTCSAIIWVKHVGDDPPHGTGPGKLPTWGRKADNRETAEEMGVGGMEIPTTSGIDGGGGI